MLNNPVADAIRDTLISPNEPDSNHGTANIVDVVAKLSRATYRISKVLSSDDSTTVTGGMYAIARAIEGLAQAVENAAVTK